MISGRKIKVQHDLDFSMPQGVGRYKVAKNALKKVGLSCNAIPLCREVGDRHVTNEAVQIKHDRPRVKHVQSTVVSIITNGSK
jgi:hypothetical protein